MEKTSPLDGLLRGRHVVLGVTGGIAAYKSIELCRRLVDGGARVTPVLTHNALRFVGEATFAALATDKPIIELWGNEDPSPHTTLARSADVVVVAPATARIISSLATGASDDTLATVLLATRAPVIVCPAMHTEMWEHAAVQSNLAVLKERGVMVVDPEAGQLAGGDVGVGRLANTDTILAAIGSAFVRKDLSGRTVLVTAGGTREPIDPVRFIGNRSSGRQGHAVAEAAVQRGATVVLVTTASVPVPAGCEVVRVDTAEQMRVAVMQRLASVDVVVMSAAVADFRPEHVVTDKVKKDDGTPQISLVPTVDILREIADRRRPQQVIVGFAAETRDIEQYARQKLQRKKLDLIVANDVSVSGSGFDSQMNNALLLGADGWQFATGLTEKRTVAAALFDRVVEILEQRGDSSNE